MPSFCAQCGITLKPYAKFCEECGVKTSSLPVSGPSFRWTGFLVAMVSLILIPVVIAFVFFAKNSSRREVASRASHEVEALLAKNIKYETNLRKVIDENQRLSGLIVHHQQTAEALALCQNTLSNVNKAKDEVMRARQTLEVEISRLKRQLATAPSSAP